MGQTLASVSPIISFTGIDWYNPKQLLVSQIFKPGISGSIIRELLSTYGGGYQNKLTT